MVWMPRGEFTALTFPEAIHGMPAFDGQANFFRVAVLQ